MNEAPFDLARHFRELFRVFLPVFVLVGGAAIIVFSVFFPGERQDSVSVPTDDLRVGLLSGVPEAGFDPAFTLTRPVERARAPTVARFDAPMGSASGAMTYNAQPFLTSRHLGDDLNGIGGWDSDRFDPVYAVADGEVIYAGWPADGWGNIAIILHRLPDGQTIESFYGHLENLKVAAGATVRRGDTVGTTGKADGRYLAHLHFEMRTGGTLNAGRGYADGALDRVPAEKFVHATGTDFEDRRNLPIVGAPAEFELPEMKIRAEAGEKTTR